MQIRRQRGEAPFGYFKQFGGMRRMSGHGLGFATRKALVAGLGWNLLVLVRALALDSSASEYIWRLILAILALLNALMRPWDRLRWSSTAYT
jgi:hypothetical protein